MLGLKGSRYAHEEVSTSLECVCYYNASAYIYFSNFGNKLMKLAKYVMNNFRRMTINMLFLRIVVRKTSYISKESLPVK